jgi:hypothetical protein
MRRSCVPSVSCASRMYLFADNLLYSSPSHPQRCSPCLEAGLRRKRRKMRIAVTIRAAPRPSAKLLLPLLGIRGRTYVTALPRLSR